MSAAEQRLGQALQAEHAAIFAYGVIGAHLDSATVQLARLAEGAHRTRRDRLQQLLRSRSADVPAAESAYALPFPVTDRITALRLAVGTEQACAAAWWAALGETDGDDRRLALAALTDCAVRTTQARTAAGIRPSTVPLPGTTP